MPYEPVLIGGGGGLQFVDMIRFSQQTAAEKEDSCQGSGNGGFQTEVRVCLKICDCSHQLRGVPGPPGPKCQKTSQKGRLGPVGPECQKSVEKVKKVPKKSLFGTFSALFRLLRDFFGPFLALRADRPETTFQREAKT